MKMFTVEVMCRGPREIELMFQEPVNQHADPQKRLTSQGNHIPWNRSIVISITITRVSVPAIHIDDALIKFNGLDPGQRM